MAYCSYRYCCGAKDAFKKVPQKVPPLANVEILTIVNCRVDCIKTTEKIRRRRIPGCEDNSIHLLSDNVYQTAAAKLDKHPNF